MYQPTWTEEIALPSGLGKRKLFGWLTEIRRQKQGEMTAWCPKTLFRSWFSVDGECRDDAEPGKDEEVFVELEAGVERLVRILAGQRVDAAGSKRERVGKRGRLSVK